MKLLKLLQTKWIDWVRSQGETGMGYIVVTVVLKDGRQVKRIAIDNGYICAIYGHDNIPFTEDDIAEMIATHDKWNFQTGQDIGERFYPYRVRAHNLGEIAMGAEAYGISVECQNQTIDALWEMPVIVSSESPPKVDSEESNDERHLILKGAFAVYIFDLEEMTISLYRVTIRGPEGIWSEENPSDYYASKLIESPLTEKDLQLFFENFILYPVDSNEAMEYSFDLRGDTPNNISVSQPWKKSLPYSEGTAEIAKKYNIDSTFITDKVFLVGSIDGGYVANDPRCH